MYVDYLTNFLVFQIFWLGFLHNLGHATPFLTVHEFLNNARSIDKTPHSVALPCDSKYF